MALRTLAGSLVLVLAATVQASAHAPAPLVATALVEDVKSDTADIAFMDYVGLNQVIQLGPKDVLVLSYLKSCEYETITGGKVTVGAQQSDVQGGQVVRTKVACDGGKMRLSAAQADQSAASAFRLQNADIERTLYSLSPVVQLSKRLAGGDRLLLIERTDRPGERYSVKLDDANAAAAGFYDLAKSHVSLTRGATYDASIDDAKVTFEIDARAQADTAPVVSRLLHFQ